MEIIELKQVGFEVLMWALGLLGTIITTVLIPQLATWLKSKTENEKLQYVIDELSQTAQTSVAYVNQTFVDQLKADGKFDKEHQKEALDKALNMALNSLTDKTKQILGKNGIDIEEMLIKYIEGAIANGKK